MKALELYTDSLPMVATLNNLGALKLESGRLDSVYVYLNKALHISNNLGGVFLQTIRNNFALYYEKKQQYDLAFYYYRVSLTEAEKNNDVEMIARGFSNLGNLFFLTKQIDSALWYIAQSKVVAGEHGFLEILSDNYRILSQIERSKGRYRNALAYHERYSRLRDSVFNVEVFGDISQLQRLYEVSKTNRQIEQLFIEQQIKQRTIGYLRIILIILFLLTAVLLVSFFQKRKLNTAYQTLFEKNIKIIDIQNSTSGKQPEKYKKSAMTDDLQSELLDKILVLMEDAAIICDTDFSIDRLAELVQSNQTYVSQTINNVLRKNFRSFLNEYRIREAQRLFSSPDAFKYTIEATALQVGFKSQSSFRDAFKEVTGVNPNFYLKSMKNLG
jgi:AraC-like DNA-binding protein